MLAHRRPGEFYRSSVLHGDRPSCVELVQLADLALFSLNLEEQRVASRGRRSLVRS